MSEELKPCPFCGSPGNIRHVENEWGGWGQERDDEYYPECSNDYCPIELYAEHSYEEAVESWNIRLG